MPIYQFLCKDCGEVSEILVGVVHDPDGPRCRACGSTNVEKAFSAPSLARSRKSRVKKQRKTPPFGIAIKPKVPLG